MANTFELISSYTVGSGGAASIDFTSIPATYTDLCVKLSARSETSGANFWAAVNLKLNNSSANFTYRELLGAVGIGIYSGSGSTGQFTWMVDNNSTANTFGNAEIYIPNYTAATNKSISVDFVTENNGTNALLQFSAGLWSDTAAINQLTLSPASGDFAQYTTAYLYGVKNA